MTASSVTSATTAIPRGWRSLLTGRWHRSSWVVGALVLLFLVFCNVPGQYVTRIDVEQSHPAIDSQLEHGWPLTYLVRKPARDLFDEPSAAWVWALHLGVNQFLAVSLVANVVLAGLTSIIAGAAFEAWRRARQHLWQFHVRDLALLLTVICLVVGWYAAKIHRHRRERLLLEPLATCERQMTGGITWLRLALPGIPCEALDPIVEIKINPARLGELPPLPHVLPDVRSVVLVDDSTQSELDALRKFPNVEALEIFLLPADEAAQTLSNHSVTRFRLPTLRKLRKLVVYGDNRVTGLEELESLEDLILRHGVDQPMVRELSRLRRLKSLYISSYTSLGGMSLSSLRHLERLSISVHDDDNELLWEIGQLPRLKHLRLWAEPMPPCGLRHLVNLKQLEEFDLFSVSEITASDIHALAQLPSLRSLDLSDTPATPDLISALAGLTQLRQLIVPQKTFPQAEVQRLRESLPECSIQAPVRITY